jgi:hypothetical protein
MHGVKFELSAQARVKALGIVNNWPARSRGWIKLVERLGAALDLSEEDKAAITWRAVETPSGQTVYAYQGSVRLACELSEEDARALRALIEPSENATYTRSEYGLLAELEAALGELA